MTATHACPHARPSDLHETTLADSVKYVTAFTRNVVALSVYYSGKRTAGQA